MDYTKNYHLPQWVKSDRIMMDDFNEAMSAMENGMTATDQKADNALSAANSAQQTAGNAFGPDNMPYVVGTYIGTGQEQDIILGFTPSVVMAFRVLDSNSSEGTLAQFCASGRVIAPKKLQIIDNGFRLGVEDNSYRYPKVNEKNGVYQYIAFK